MLLSSVYGIPDLTDFPWDLERTLVLQSETRLPLVSYEWKPLQEERGHR